MRIRHAITTQEELRMLCIVNDWFTAGTNSQYEKLFELNDQPVSVRDMALVIWLCSNDKDMEEIHEKLAEAKDEYQATRREE